MFCSTTIDPLFMMLEGMLPRIVLLGIHASLPNSQAVNMGASQAAICRNLQYQGTDVRKLWVAKD
jgi:hypothetical protein